MPDDAQESTPTTITVWSGFDYSYSLIFHGRSWRIHVPFGWSFEPDPTVGVVLGPLWAGGPRLGPLQALDAAREGLYGFKVVDDKEGRM